MPQIQVLDEHTIDKIAAGEVVERPSSVVKELVENAIDAKATAVTVEIRDGGISLIRITDNGFGIPMDQIPLAFYRHSTSKIRSVEDLVTISSLGFRGEALSSIASVAQVELITKTPEAFTGCRYLIEGGKEISLEEIGAPNGTTFLVKNLFYNTPARKKFLKSAQTETGYISDLMDRMALSHPDVSFKFITNGQVRLHTSGNGQLKDIIYHVYGRDIAANLLSIDQDFGSFHVSGYIGKPVICRGNRNFESYFINGRYIKSKLIAKSIEDGYHGFMMQHKYPFTVLSLDINGELVDVNVHPNKMELRFSNGEEIYQHLTSAIQNALRQKELITEVSLDEKKTTSKRPVEKPSAVPEPFEQRRLEKLREAVRKDSPYEKKYAPLPEQTKSPAPELKVPGSEPEPEKSYVLPPVKKQAVEEKSPFAEPVRETVQTTLADLMGEKDPLLSMQARPKHKIIGQLFETYWLVEFQDKFYMIDQHAAHEKVLFEQTMKNYRSREFTSQMISPPILLSLTMQEELLLKKHMSYFTELGFVIESFGGKEYTISAVPANLYGINGQSLIVELIDMLGSWRENEAPEQVMEKIASMSCKAAVKGNMKLSRPEIEQLIDDLLKLDNPYFCPHGRPVIISMTKYEIEKKFKRIV